MVAHGSRDGFLEFPDGNVNGGQLVDAVTNNPYYNGGPLRLMEIAGGRGPSAAVVLVVPHEDVGPERHHPSGSSPWPTPTSRTTPSRPGPCTITYAGATPTPATPTS